MTITDVSWIGCWIRREGGKNDLKEFCKMPKHVAELIELGKGKREVQWEMEERLYSINVWPIT